MSLLAKARQNRVAALALMSATKRRSADLMTPPEFKSRRAADNLNEAPAPTRRLLATA